MVRLLNQPELYQLNFERVSSLASCHGICAIGLFDLIVRLLLTVLAHLHCQRQISIPIPNSMATYNRSHCTESDLDPDP